MKEAKTPVEVIEFQTDALEIKNQRLPLWAQLCVYLPLVVLFGAILWASLAKVDVIVQATGKLVTDNQTIVMKPLERSVIKEVNVRIGDIVKPNQVLFTFDPTINLAEAEKLRGELSTLTAKYERLRAEFEGKEYKATKAGDINQDWQTAIYLQRNEYYREKINYYDEAVKQLDASKRSREATLANQRERLEAIKRIEQMFQQMFEKQVTSLKELLQIQITRMEMEASVDEMANSLLELGHQRASTISTKNSFVQEWLNNISEELVKTDREINTTRREYEKVEQLISYLYLRSPCEAVVHEIAQFSPGAAVREAEALITLIPLDGKVELEAEIRPQDIGKVKLGSEVRVKLNAYPFQRYGTLDGKVRNLSEDTIQRQQQSKNPEETASYYRARVQIWGKLRNIGPNFRLIPGMETQVEVKTGRRRVIEYITYPLIKALDETAREP